MAGSISDSDTMQAVTVGAFGKPDDMMEVRTMPRPVWVAGKKTMLIRVQAVSLSPGDCRTYNGSVRFVRRPKFPYVPSGDVCGIVEQLDAGGDFNVGDAVIASWDATPYGGAAEYCLVNTKLVRRKPAGLSAAEACALPNSPGNAVRALQAAGVKKGSRVLILGGSGGVGTTMVQLAKTHFGAGFVAVTSTQGELMRSLGADQVIDYTTAHWWEDAGLKASPVDHVIDLAEGRIGWRRARTSGVLKKGTRGGRFTGVISDDPKLPMRHVGHIFNFIRIIVQRQTWTSMMRWRMPRWHAYIGGSAVPALDDAMELHKAGEFKIVLDPRGPFPFTTAGAREAYNILESKHAHGKAVIQIAPLDAVQGS